jgi:hypothetical protein
MALGRGQHNLGEQFSKNAQRKWTVYFLLLEEKEEENGSSPQLVDQSASRLVRNYISGRAESRKVLQTTRSRSVPKCPCSLLFVLRMGFEAVQWVSAYPDISQSREINNSF